MKTILSIAAISIILMFNSCTTEITEPVYNNKIYMDSLIQIHQSDKAKAKLALDALDYEEDKINKIIQSLSKKWLVDSDTVEMNFWFDKLDRIHEQWDYWNDKL